MKKVMRFIKRRICPIMLALVIVFFSVVIPCAKVEASAAPQLPPASVFEVIEGGASGATSGVTYFDLLGGFFTGFELAPIIDSDGNYSTVSQELYNDVIDTIELWAETNYRDFKELALEVELRGLLDDAKDGVITMSKNLWEALQQYALNACDYSSQYPLVNQLFDSTNSPSYDVSGFPYHFNACVYDYNQQKITASGDIWSNSPCKAICLYYGSHYETYLLSSSQFRCKNWAGTYTSSRYSGSLFYMSFFTVTFENGFIHGVPVISCSSRNSYFDSLSSVDDVPDFHPPWPVQSLNIEKVNPPTWDDAIADQIIIPGAQPDTAEITLPRVLPDPEPVPDPDPDPEEVPDPDPIDPDPPIDPEPEPDPDPTDPVPPPEDDEDIVTPEEIGTLPDIAGGGGDITKLFPFCIPFDLVALIKGMKAQEKAPVWHFKYYFKDINYTFEFTVDMTDYETYIKIFRAGMVIFWIITLMFITIRYSSGIAKD